MGRIKCAIICKPGKKLEAILPIARSFSAFLQNSKSLLWLNQKWAIDLFREKLLLTLLFLSLEREMDAERSEPAFLPVTVILPIWRPSGTVFLFWLPPPPSSLPRTDRHTPFCSLGRLSGNLFGTSTELELKGILQCGGISILEYKRKRERVEALGLIEMQRSLTWDAQFA